MKPPHASIQGRRTAATPPAGFVKWNTLPECGALPMVCEPVVRDLDLPAWMRMHADAIRERLLAHGAILFRGFSIPDIRAFDACITALSGGALEYLFRASPRTRIRSGVNVYTSTDYPSEETIFPHNEHSYSPTFPLHLYFYCDLPAANGGQTPLGSTREVLQRIDPAVRSNFLRKGIMYVRNYGDGMGLPWRSVFQAEDRSEVESYCRTQGIQCEWKPGERLRTRQVGPAMMRHPLSHEPIWFNHGTFFHELTLPSAVRDQLRSEFADEDLPQNTFYGDGSAIEAEVIAHLQQAYRDSMRQFDWQAHDLLLLDNMLTVHARTAFRGPRRIMTGMAQAYRSAALGIVSNGAVDG